MAVKWFAIYKVADGSLVSVGTLVDPNLDASLASVEVSAPAVAVPQNWDKATHQFMAAQPLKSDIERSQVMPAYAEWQMWNAIAGMSGAWGLTAPQAAQITAQVAVASAALKAAVQAWQNGV